MRKDVDYSDDDDDGDNDDVVLHQMVMLMSTNYAFPELSGWDVQADSKSILAWQLSGMASEISDHPS